MIRLKKRPGLRGRETAGAPQLLSFRFRFSAQRISAHLNSAQMIYNCSFKYKINYIIQLQNYFQLRMNYVLGKLLAGRRSDRRPRKSPFVSRGYIGNGERVREQQVHVAREVAACHVAACHAFHMFTGIFT